MKFLCIFLITLCSFGEANLQYCNKCRYHTMCGTVKSGPRCFNHKSIPPNKKQIKEILHFHNSIRNRVANGWEKRGKPGPLYSAANMMKMVCFWCSEWDDELAKIAQRAADQCVFLHDCGACRTVIGDRFSVGQNCAMVKSSHQLRVNFTAMMKNWYLGQVSAMNKNLVKSFRSGRWGHFSQVIWWNSRLVGCGSAMYDDGAWRVHHVFCNYGSAGNVHGTKVYEIGPPASRCPPGTSRGDPKYKGLCVIKNRNQNGRFLTDDVILGTPPGTFLAPPKCRREGFRL